MKLHFVFLAVLLAMSPVGAAPFSTHFSSAPIESNVFTPGPPPQCPMPGAMNSRTQSLWFWPILRRTDS